MAEAEGGHQVDVNEDVQEMRPKKSKKKKDASYPLKVLYCGVCTMPVEYCEFNPAYKDCKKWLADHCPDLFERLTLQDEEEGGEDKKKKQKRGGRGVMKVKKKIEPQTVTISRMQRQKKKFVTVVRGLGSHDIDVRDAAKAFASRFSCGASVSGEDEIVIQGDVTDDLLSFIPEKFRIDEENIEDLGDMKK
ncbi:density-regulated protein homolog [Acanthaster planci]|uniref:Density-regulated protein homolog n=1 Tax=Acanthaster planci TaxID=133434 RepID=A0A8B7XZK7_ACAPL|nr:density-regulated protein homolog [Acanthaster planci]XP_022085698.1 density-regulated protein homolog [Acanthaster planci]XP_022085699.1 density-regulated protein homolog [Acanthaster planci]XP_022085700.1 density-regulated protein homolog [Acanthaster planci]